MVLLSSSTASNKAAEVEWFQVGFPAMKVLTAHVQDLASCLLSGFDSHALLHSQICCLSVISAVFPSFLGEVVQTSNQSLPHLLSVATP